MRADDLARGGAPHAAALVAGDTTLSYAAFDAAIEAEAARLRREGLRPGDRVAIYEVKTLAAVVAMFAAWRAGGVAVPVNPVLKPAQVAHILADSGAALLLTSAARSDALAAAQALGTARILSLPSNPAHPEPVEASTSAAARPQAGAPASPARPGVAQGGGDLAALLYTSGSTGRPKGVMLSHANLTLAADSVATFLALAPGDVALCVLPLSFDAGLSVLTSALKAGGRAVLLDYLAPADVVRAVERHRVTTLSGVPPLFVQLADARWPAGTTLRRLTVTGGRMPVALTRRLSATFPAARLHLMYGLTEAFRSLALDPALAHAHPESVGRAIPHAEVLLLRPDGTEAAIGEPGELVHVGPLVAQGYWNDAERTAERFRPAPAFAQTGNVAVWSGDTLRRDAAGLHYFVARADEMIKVSGMRVSPTEVEEAAHATGAVAEAVALGVADDRLGQAILLVATPAAGLDAAAAAARLASGLAAALPAFMRPARVEWREALPRNPNGKLDRAALRDEAGA